MMIVGGKFLKIGMGPENLVLDHTQYPITFSSLTATKEYNETCGKAEGEYAKTIREAEVKLQKAREVALENLKGKLK
jgi:hypothetical protein